MYKSPIELITNQMYNTLREQRDEQVIYTIQQQCCVNVGKDELIKALQYDRNQYDEGYKDAMDSIIRCKDCRWFGMDRTKGGFCMRTFSPSMWRNESGELKPDDFCSYGKRRCVKNEQK